MVSESKLNATHDVGGLQQQAFPAASTSCVRLGNSSDRHDIAAFYRELGLECGPPAGGILPITPLMGSLFSRYIPARNRSVDE